MSNNSETGRHISRRTFVKGTTGLIGKGILVGIGYGIAELRHKINEPTPMRITPEATASMKQFQADLGRVFPSANKITTEFRDVGKMNPVTKKYPYSGHFVVIDVGGSQTKMKEVMDILANAKNNTPSMIKDIVEKNKPQDTTVVMVKKTGIDTNTMRPELLRRTVEEKESKWTWDRAIDLRTDPKNQVGIAIMGAIDTDAEYQMYLVMQDVAGDMEAVPARNLANNLIIPKNVVKIDTTVPMGPKITILPQTGK